MSSIRGTAIASFAFVFCSQTLIAQTPFGYREYTLGSSVASVVETSGARGTEAKTVHERPARIQELEWRVPYGRTIGNLADPVRDIRFSFYNDQLYKLVVTYDRDRTEGLTPADIVESLSGTYGLPLLSQRALGGPVKGSEQVPAETMPIAQWEDATTLLTLTQNTYHPQYQLVLISKTLIAQALAAIEEGLRIDVQEAPQREADRRHKLNVDARLAGDKARVINKAAFRP